MSNVMTIPLDNFPEGQATILSPIGELLDEVRQGRPVILVDDERRENEGDIVIPAELITPDLVNFMITHGRGLVCMPMAGAIADRLGLPPMTADNTTRHGTAFTVSIGARDGITTGISAHDRAHTIRVAADPAAGPADVTRPGHVFPLRANDAGVLGRAGHTEAAIDLARLAGFQPAGVICEILNEDGTMARLPDLARFARRHKMKIGAIADLIAYRQENAL